MLVTEEETDSKIISLHASAPFLFEKGMRYYNKGKLNEAISYFKRANKFDDKNCDILCQLGMSLSEDGQFEEANKVFEKILYIDSTFDDCYYFMANNFAYLGLFDEAKKYAQEFLQTTDDQILINEIEELLEIVCMEEEEGDFLPQDDLIVKQEEAMLLIRQGNFEDAVILLEDVIDEYPKCWAAYNHLSIALFQMSAFTEALRVVENLLEQNPGNLQAMCNQLMFFHSLDEFDKVAELVEELSNIYPMLTEQQVKLGTTFAAISEWDLAYKWLKHLQKVGYGGDISFHYWLSYAAYETGRIVLAEKYWNKVVEIDDGFIGFEPWQTEI